MALFQRNGYLSWFSGSARLKWNSLWGIAFGTGVNTMAGRTFIHVAQSKSALGIRFCCTGQFPRRSSIRKCYVCDRFSINILNDTNDTPIVGQALKRKIEFLFAERGNLRRNALFYPSVSVPRTLDQHTIDRQIGKPVSAARVSLNR